MIIDIKHYETLAYRNKVRDLIEDFIIELTSLGIQITTKKTSQNTTTMEQIKDSLQLEIDKLEEKRAFILRFLISNKEFLEAYNLDDIIEFKEDENE